MHAARSWREHAAPGRRSSRNRRTGEMGAVWECRLAGSSPEQTTGCGNKKMEETIVEESSHPDADSGGARPACRFRLLKAYVHEVDFQRSRLHLFLTATDSH